MSARVFNPMLISELKHIRSPGLNDRVSSFTPSNFMSMTPIRRDLFGPVDHEECKNFVERELDRQHTLRMEHWEFDFRNEIPLPGKGRFRWEPMIEKCNIRPVKRDRIDHIENDITNLYHIPLEDVSPEKEVKTLAQLKQKQAKITDFLKITRDGSHKSKLSQIKKSITTPSPRNPRIGKIPRTRRLKI